MKGADVLIHVTKNVENTKLSTISVIILSKIFEVPYKNIRSWLIEMQDYVKSDSKEIKNSTSFTQPVQTAQRNMGKIMLFC